MRLARCFGCSAVSISSENSAEAPAVMVIVTDGRYIIYSPEDLRWVKLVKRTKVNLCFQ